MLQITNYHLFFAVCCNRGKIRKELKRQIKELEEFNSFTCYSKQDDSVKAIEEVKIQQQEEQKLLEEQTKLLQTFRDDNKTVSHSCCQHKEFVLICR